MAEFISTKIPLEIISIQGHGIHCFLNLRINNKFNGRFILDTGASRTILALDYVNDIHLLDDLESTEEKACGLGTNTMEGHILTIKSLKLGDFILRNYSMGILDLSHVNEAYDTVGVPKINGALGSDILSKYLAEISFKDKSLLLYKKKGIWRTNIRL